MSKFKPIIETTDDNLVIPDVGDWSFQKWSLLGAYCDIFTNGMRNLWDQLVYIDLFAGAGFARITDTDKIFYSSPLIALSTPMKFDKYIFCEKEPDLMEALKQRTNRLFPNQDISYILGDSNKKVDDIISKIPPYSKRNTLLPFCFVDPFSLNLHFNTIKKLGRGGLMDFLILLALHMDANRNLVYYIDENSEKIEHFLGDPNWRKEFKEFGEDGVAFIRYLADKIDRNMMELGYESPEEKHQVRSSYKNLPLYYLAFYSKHERGNDFYRKVKKTATGQTELGI